MTGTFFADSRLMGDQLRRWADVILVAPLSANTLAKFSNGICDNLLTSLMRALDAKRTKVYVFPAMNTHMWDHPFTAKQLDILKSIGYQVVGPVGKLLACGDIGMLMSSPYKAPALQSS